MCFVSIFHHVECRNVWCFRLDAIRGQPIRCPPAFSATPHKTKSLTHKKQGGGLNRTSRSNRHLVCRAAKSPYDALGVSKQATTKEIKSAFRKKALKLHPDVNKAPNAREQFMEAKNAYLTLVDPETRAQYDRQSDFDTWSSGNSKGFDWGSSSRSTNKEPEEFYGLDEFLKDLDKEMSDWSSRTSNKGEPKDLFGELEVLGLEFVEFLEEGLGITDEQSSPDSSSSTGTEQSKAESNYQDQAELNKKQDSPEDEIERILQQMKDNLGL